MALGGEELVKMITCKWDWGEYVTGFTPQFWWLLGSVLGVNLAMAGACCLLTLLVVDMHVCICASKLLLVFGLCATFIWRHLQGGFGATCRDKLDHPQGQARPPAGAS